MPVLCTPGDAGGVVCRCGHPRDAHEHYRRGTECALCAECPRFRLPASPLRRLLASVAHRVGCRSAGVRQNR